MGYVLVPGERWKGDYLVADLDDFRAGKAVHIQQVKEVYEVEGESKFPLFEARQKGVSLDLDEWAEDFGAVHWEQLKREEQKQTGEQKGPGSRETNDCQAVHVHDDFKEKGVGAGQEL